MPKIASIGEVMIELSPAISPSQNQDLKSLSFAGDTYNTIITLARLGVDCGYITRLGEDGYSEKIVRFLQEEGVDTAGISKDPQRKPGLYMIENIAGGERIFHYWRDQSAARNLLTQNETLTDIKTYIATCEWLYVSAISLAILDEVSCEILFSILEEFKANGGKIAYDSNYRPRLWKNKARAQELSMRMVSLSNLSLLTLDDEAELWGSEGDPLKEAQLRYQECKTEEIAYKRGADDVVIFKGTQQTNVPVKTIKNIVDTTAAGDTFNAGYLASHIQGGSPENSAKLGNLCAGIVIQHRGGVIEKSIFLDSLKAQ
jgi:2-dehydro-3-deoxygluconokinase